MPRDYRELLELSQELQYYERYLNTETLKEKNKLQGRFNDERRAFVYALFKEGGDKRTLAPSVSAELDVINTTTPYGDTTIAYVREQLLKHIGKAVDHHPVQRFVVRWGPPTAAAAVAIAYAYVHFGRL